MTEAIAKALKAGQATDETNAQLFELGIASKQPDP